MKVSLEMLKTETPGCIIETVFNDDSGYIIVRNKSGVSWEWKSPSIQRLRFLPYHLAVVKDVYDSRSCDEVKSRLLDYSGSTIL